MEIAEKPPDMLTFLIYVFIISKEIKKEGNIMMVILNSAYLDPSVITIAFSAVAGVAVTIGAAVAVYYHKVKKKVNDKLGIDENAKKEVEADVTGSFGE